jgi:hypothetical protein
MRNVRPPHARNPNAPASELTAQGRDHDGPKDEFLANMATIRTPMNGVLA